MMPAPNASTPRRALLVNLDFRDFVYSHLWGRAVLDACARRNLIVDTVAVNPFVERDLGAELGVSRSTLQFTSGGTAVCIDTPDESRSRAAVGELLDRHHYDTLILNCDAALFIHLMVEREHDLAGTRWLVYDRHLHIDLRAHSNDPHLRDRMIASGMHLFTIEEIATGKWPTLQPDEGEGLISRSLQRLLGNVRPSTLDESEIIRSFKRLGLPLDRIHLQKWPLDDVFFAPPPAAATPKDAFVVFSGGDSSRDYATLFEAIRELPVQLRLCAGRYPTPAPPNVTILPRLRLHQFRDEMARATVVVVPLTGEPPVSGITVIAMAKMLAKPVIASENPVVRMHIRSHGDGGYLTQTGDVALLRALLTRLIDTPAERDRLGREARAQAVRDLSLRAFVDRMLACGESLAANHSV